ncbi:MAG: YeeE/YedE thiosulfate transporter family protein [Candidatus Syntropharchaeia archaeon]
MAMRRNEIKVRSPQPGRNGKRQLFLGIIGIFIATGITLLYLHSDSDVAIFFLFGIGFGVIIQRSRFCFVTCYKDLFVTRDVSLFKAIVIAMLVSTIGFSLIMYHMVPDALLAYSWEWLYPDLLEGTKIWLPQYLGWGWSVFLTIAILVVVYLGISYWEVAGWD